LLPAKSPNDLNPYDFSTGDPVLHALKTTICFSMFMGFIFAADTPALAQESDALKHYRTGFELLKAQNFRNAAIELEKAAAADSSEARSFYALGKAYTALNDYPKAITAYEHTLALGQYQDRIPKVLAQLYHKAGIEAYGERKYADAIGQLEKSLKHNPKNAAALFAVGLCHTSLRAPSAAQASFERTIKADPRYFKAYKALGDIYYQRREYAPAQKQYEKSLEINPKFTDAYGGLGRVLIDSGDLEKAVSRMEEATQTNPKYAEGFLFQGMALVKLQRFHQAVPPLRQAIDYNGKNAEAHYRLAEAYYGKGDYSDAIQSGQQAVGRRKNFHAAELVLGDAHAKLGQTQDARSWYNRALKDNRYRDYAQHQLEALDTQNR
jgi:tetratricopeptide (TPR) repeat protein